MTFHPLKTAKESPLSVLFLILVGYILITAIDDRTGDRLSTFVKSKVG